MQYYIKILALLLSFYITIIYRCTDNISGTETETQTGTLSAKVLKGTDSTIFCNKVVRLHQSKTSNNTKSITTHTDSLGAFILDSVVTGTYYLEIGDSCFATLNPCTVKVNSIWHDTLYAVPTGTILGNLCVPFIGKIFNIEVYIKEIDRKIKIDSSGIFTIPFLPSYSDYTFTFNYFTESMNIPVYTDNSIKIISGDTTNLGNIALFKGNARIYGTCQQSILSAHHAALSITAYNLLPMHSQMTIVDSVNVYGIFEGIPEGLDRIFKVEVFDSSNVVLYTGIDTTDIVADSTSTLYININRK